MILSKFINQHQHFYPPENKAAKMYKPKLQQKVSLFSLDSILFIQLQPYPILSIDVSEISQLTKKSEVQLKTQHFKEVYRRRFLTLPKIQFIGISEITVLNNKKSQRFPTV